jgi:hypothetical protein
MSARPTLRRAALLATLLFACAAWSGIPSAAHASYTSCRSDPALLLSNGTTMDLGATIQDSASDVRSTNYVVVGPAGTFLLSVVPTDGLLGLTEHFTYKATNPAGTYDVYTTVTTGQPMVPVTTNGLLIGLLKVAFPSVSGYSGQTLHSHI